MSKYLQRFLSSRALLAVTSVAIAAGFTAVSYFLQAQSSGSPDLVIQNIQFVRQRADLATVEFDVANVGQASVTDWFSMAVYIDGSIYTQTFYIQQNNGTQYGVDANAVIPILPAGHYHVALSNYYWLAAGNHTVRIVADAVDPSIELNPSVRGLLRNNMIREADEGNNSAEISVSQSSSSSSSVVASSSSFVQGWFCSDSDGGDRVDVPGTVSTPGGFSRDHCENSTNLNSRLIEYTCTANDMASRYVTCPYGCDQGACEPQGGSVCVRILDQQTCGTSQRGGKQCVWNAAIALCTDAVGSGNTATCTDSDGGERYDIRGSISMRNFGGNDNCENEGDPQSKLNEYFCAPNGDMGARSISCPYGCSNGRCVSRSGDQASSSSASVASNPQTNCTDSDGGDEPNRSGEVVVTIPGVAEQARSQDECLDDRPTGTDWMDIERDNVLLESFCDATNYIADKEYTCPFLCRNGRCWNSGERENGAPEIRKVWVTREPDCQSWKSDGSQEQCLEYRLWVEVRLPSGTLPTKDVMEVRLFHWSDRYDKFVNGSMIAMYRYPESPNSLYYGLQVGQFESPVTERYLIEAVKDGKRAVGEYVVTYDANLPVHSNTETSKAQNTSRTSTATFSVASATSSHAAMQPPPPPPMTTVQSSSASFHGCPAGTMCVLTGSCGVRGGTCAAHESCGSSEVCCCTLGGSESHFEDVVRTTSADESRFSDVGTDTLEGKAANALARQRIMGGYPDGEFKGGKLVNRAEAAKFLLLARYGSVPDMKNNGRFPDVLSGEWYEKFVMYAANMGIIKGHADGLYRPANSVNTAEFLKMLTLTFGLDLNLPQTYLDVSTQAWFAPYAGIAEKYGLFPHRDSQYLQPSRELTRSEVTVALYQYLKSAGAISE